MPKKALRIETNSGPTECKLRQRHVFGNLCKQALYRKPMACRNEVTVTDMFRIICAKKNSCIKPMHTRRNVNFDLFLIQKSICAQNNERSWFIQYNQIIRIVIWIIPRKNCQEWKNEEKMPIFKGGIFTYC